MQRPAKVLPVEVEMAAETRGWRVPAALWVTTWSIPILMAAFGLRYLAATVIDLSVLKPALLYMVLLPLVTAEFALPGVNVWAIWVLVSDDGHAHTGHVVSGTALIPLFLVLLCAFGGALGYPGVS
jgi:hypothetical protein